jgi:hypothetical protein
MTMTNRLADLETNVTRAHKKKAGVYKKAKLAKRARKPQGVLTRVGTEAPPAATTPAPVVSKGLSELVSGWPSRGMSLARAFAGIDYSIPGVFGPLAQPTGNSCWATVFTMLMSWRRQQSLSIENALAIVGQQWVDLFKADTGLPGSQKSAFLTAAGLIAEPPQSYSLEGWEQLLRNYGPIWVTTDEAPGKAWAIHARVITAIKGDGTPEKTFFTIVDPAGGKQYQESIATFIPKYEEEVIRTGYMRIQVVHWTADARAEVKAQSFGGRTLSTRRRAGALAVPAAVPIASAIVGATMTRILNDEGDIHYELDQMSGLKHVNDNASNAGTATFPDKRFTITGPRATTTRFKDQIYFDTEITFQSNGRSLGNVQMSKAGSDDAVAAGLTVKGNINNDANEYERAPSTTTFAAIKIRIHYEFSFTFYSDPYIWIDDIVLYGDGTHTFQRRRLQ